MSKETANVVQSLCAICAVLADSAEAVAEVRMRSAAPPSCTHTA